MNYYHLRIDAPTTSFVKEHLEMFQKNHKLDGCYLVKEISPTGKIHFHGMVLCDEATVQPMRQYMGVTYKKSLKEYPHYWEKTYKDSKKIQVYSFQKVKHLAKMWSYIHKDVPKPEGPSRISFETRDVPSQLCAWDSKWDWSRLEALIVNAVEDTKEAENKLQKELDEFWKDYKILTNWNTLEPHQRPLYYYNIQTFHDFFGDIKGFRVHFLKSAYRNEIISFLTYADKMYRL